jgi:O-antigen/teichoic acid export membrane protein
VFPLSEVALRYAEWELKEDKATSASTGPATLPGIYGVFQDFSQLLLGKREPAGPGEHVARGTAGLFASRICFTGLMFLVSVFLARLLSSGGYGAYTYAFAWVLLLGVPGILGTDQLLVRELAVFRTRGAWDLIRGLIRQTNAAVLLASLALAACAAMIAKVVLTGRDAQSLEVFWLALVLLPFITLTRARQAALQGLNILVLGQLPETIVQPALFLLLLAAAYWRLGRHLTATWAMGMNVAAAAAAFAVGALLLRKYLPAGAKSVKLAYPRWTWLRSALPLMFLSSVAVIYGQADVLILGAIKGTKAVGVYGVADRGAELLAFLFTAAISAMAPTIASLYASRDLQALQRIVTKLVRVTLALTLPAAIAFIGFGYWVLLWIYGADYVAGQRALAILSAGQLVNVAMGPVGMLLIMTGHETDATWSIGISAVVNVALNFALVPKWGLEGAAISAASSMVLWNFLMARAVHKRFGIHSTVLGKISF